MSNQFEQVILFGSPGTGKSRSIVSEMIPDLGIDPEGENCIKTVFHPEYTYGDFMGKLMPLTNPGKVEYNFYSGYFMKALARAYRNILVAEEGEEPDKVTLVIDEINRGNSAAIFGTAFQLLDRDDEGWSVYKVDLSKMEFEQLLHDVGFDVRSYSSPGVPDYVEFTFRGVKKRDDDINEILEPLKIRRNQIRIPSNLSIFATMNTSDNSIYYMDAAFKRRWDWQFVDTTGESPNPEGIAFASRADWQAWVDTLNSFIRDHHGHVRKVEDKQIGHWFVTGSQISNAEIQNKVMFFLWDSVFTTSKKPLAELFDVDESSLVTFGEFASQTRKFINAVSNA